jgi:hypothetical protein
VPGLQAQWGAIAGADFFTTEVWTWRGLVTYYTVFVIDLASRRALSPRTESSGGWTRRSSTTARVGRRASGFGVDHGSVGCRSERAGCGAAGGLAGLLNFYERAA